MSIKTLRGDTIIEVLLATTIFALISISTMVIMNSNTNNLESNLELTMVRAEVDAQAEAIRFIHDAYVAEGDYSVIADLNSSKSQYYRLWKYLTEDLATATDTGAPDVSLDSCSDYYNGQNSIFASNRKSYALDTRTLSVLQNSEGAFDDSEIKKIVFPANQDVFVPAITHSRIVYGDTDPDEQELIADNATEISSVQGLWVNTVPAQIKTTETLSAKPEFFDFHVYTCWYGPGRNHPTTIGTIIRLYNPAIGGSR